MTVALDHRPDDPSSTHKEAGGWHAARTEYLANAGPYAGEDRHRQLAERIEGLISQEHAKWTASRQDPREGSGRR
jgi:hypothetical protein